MMTMNLLPIHSPTLLIHTLPLVTPPGHTYTHTNTHTLDRPTGDRTSLPWGGGLVSGGRTTTTTTTPVGVGPPPPPLHVVVSKAAAATTRTTAPLTAIMSGSVSWGFDV